MDRTETGELSVHDAVERLEKAFAYDAPLRTRGEGLSWMMWGLVVTVAILVSERIHPSPLAYAYLFVIPSFAASAILGSAAVWRLAGVARPSLSPSPTRIALGIVALFLGGVLVTFGWMFVDATGSYAVLATAIAAIPWGLLGWAQWGWMTQAGRRAMVAAGVVMAILLTAYLELVWPGDDMARFYLGVHVIGAVPFLLGLAWTFRR